MDFEPIAKTVSKIVGTSFENRQELLARVKAEGITTAYLELDPTNQYDLDAIQVKTTFWDGTEVLGHIQNGDRLCLGVLPNGKECGVVIDGSTVSRSRTVRCPACGLTFTADRTNTVLIAGGLDKQRIVTCSCGTRFAFGLHNVYVHSCGCSEQARIGLASRLAESMRHGIAYKVQILEITGGELVDGNQRSYGCNVRIEALNVLVEV